VLRFLSMLVVLLLAGCVAPAGPEGGIAYDPCGPVVLAPSPDTTAAETDSVANAIALWRAVGLSTLTLDDVPGAVRVPVQFKQASPLFNGLYEPQTGDVLVNRGLEGTARDVTVAHEVGHALGLPHVDASQRVSVMNPSNVTVPPNDGDERALQALWSCPPAP